MTDLHEASFKWPAGPSKVIVTGEFDNWSQSTELTKTDDGFTGTFHLPWAGKSSYKYVVDGEWTTNPAEPKETDASGNVNNVYTSPPKPEVETEAAPIPAPDLDFAPAATEADEPAPAPAAAVDVPEIALAPAAAESEPAPAPAPAAEKTSMEGVKGNAASVVSYMASGLGAAFASVTGIDPINPQQIPIEDDKAQEILAAKSVPEPEATKTESAPVEEKKPIVDALAPIIDEPVVLNLLPAASSTISQTATTVKDSVPTSVEEVKAVAASVPTVSDALSSAVAAAAAQLPSAAAITSTLPEPIVAAAGKVQETIAPPTAVAIPDAPEPYKEPVVTEPVAVPDAVEPYKETNGTLPGETTAAPSKVSETADKVKEAVVAPSTDAAATVEGKASEAVEKVKETVGAASSSGEKHAFPATSETAPSTTSTAVDGGDRTGKRKTRHSIFGKLKEVFTPEKQKKDKTKA